MSKKKICYACQDISVSKIIKTDSSTLQNQNGYLKQIIWIYL